MDPNQTFEFISLIQEEPCLWRKQDKFFMNREMRKKCFEAIGEKMNMTGNEHPIYSNFQAQTQAMHRGHIGHIARSQHPTQRKDTAAGRSSLIISNPLSRSSKIIEMALQKNLLSSDKPISDNENEFNVSVTDLLPLSNVEMNDFSPNASFSEYLTPQFPPKTRMTNVNLLEYQPLPAIDYLDLSTGKVSVVGTDSSQIQRVGTSVSNGASGNIANCPEFQPPPAEDHRDLSSENVEDTDSRADFHAFYDALPHA